MGWVPKDRLGKVSRLLWGVKLEWGDLKSPHSHERRRCAEEGHTVKPRATAGAMSLPSALRLSHSSVSLLCQLTELAVTLPPNYLPFPESNEVLPSPAFVDAELAGMPPSLLSLCLIL